LVFGFDILTALGMPEGAPPPWLLNMQRFGPPPSYPNLKISGLNAPIPEGARYGFHAGGMLICFCVFVCIFSLFFVFTFFEFLFFFFFCLFC
jgi:hypothetical protein